MFGCVSRRGCFVPERGPLEFSEHILSWQILWQAPEDQFRAGQSEVDLRVSSERPNLRRAVREFVAKRVLRAWARTKFGATAQTLVEKSVSIWLWTSLDPLRRLLGQTSAPVAPQFSQLRALSAHFGKTKVQTAEAQQGLTPSCPQVVCWHGWATGCSTARASSPSHIWSQFASTRANHLKCSKLCRISAELGGIWGKVGPSVNKGWATFRRRVWPEFCKCCRPGLV